jgi:hypothetical protein
MFNGAHVVISSKNPEADRAFLREVLGLPHVDVGHGWLIFALPPAEVAVHPGEKNDVHEFYLMVSDLEDLIGTMARRGVPCTPPRTLGWGILTQLSLPGGGTLGVYEPRHARPRWPRLAKRHAAPAAKKRAPSRGTGGTRRRAGN